jgi:hypothetical protein
VPEEQRWFAELHRFKPEWLRVGAVPAALLPVLVMLGRGVGAQQAVRKLRKTLSDGFHRHVWLPRCKTTAEKDHLTRRQPHGHEDAPLDVQAATASADQPEPLEEARPSAARVAAPGVSPAAVAARMDEPAAARGRWWWRRVGGSRVRLSRTGRQAARADEAADWAAAKFFGHEMLAGPKYPWQRRQLVAFAQAHTARGRAPSEPRTGRQPAPVAQEWARANTAALSAGLMAAAVED